MNIPPERVLETVWIRAGESDIATEKRVVEIKEDGVIRTQTLNIRHEKTTKAGVTASRSAEY